MVKLTVIEKVDMYPPCNVDPPLKDGVLLYTQDWFRMQWPKLYNGWILITSNGSYVRTERGFERF